MTETVDTRDEAVERLARWYETPPVLTKDRETAATLRALLARAERAEKERDEARSYLAALMLTYHPEVEPLPDLKGVCTQIDNAMSGMWQKREAARREGMRAAASAGKAAALQHLEVGARMGLRATIGGAAQAAHDAIMAMLVKEAENAPRAKVAARVEAAQREGLREAADLCDELHEHTPGVCAAAIRALLEDAPRAVAEAQPVARRTECVERWSDCADGEYDPRCCRFPKSCSCALLEAGR